MNYYELTFTYTATVDPTILSDILADSLGEIGFESFTNEGDKLLGYIPENIYNVSRIDEQLTAFPLPDVTIHYTAQLIESKDWNEEWERNYFQPIRIDQSCIIRASFHPAEEGYEHEIIIDPKMAFGTGNHETTYLMIRSLLDLNLQHLEVLDMGCGTAVLAILARMKGAQHVVGIDIDEWAYRNALENIRLNHTENIEIRLGGAEQLQDDESFDLILANINRNILLADIQHYARVLRTNGTLFMSGFYTADIPAIEAECKRCGLCVISHTSRHDWCAVHVEKKKDQTVNYHK